MFFFLFFFIKVISNRKMKYCCHICAGSGQYSVSSFGRVQYRLRGHVADYLVFHPTAPQTQSRKSTGTLSLFPWKISRRASLVISTSSVIYGKNSPCYVQGLESPTFLPYSTFKEDVPIRCFRELLICGTSSRVDAFLNTKILTFV